MTESSNFNGIGYREMREFLEEKYLSFNREEFIWNDPVSIPHQYTNQKDIEISAFLTATIAWGRRDLIIKSARKQLEMMGNNPYQFLMEADNDDLEEFSKFYYRTYNGIDSTFFLKSLKSIYSNYNSLEDIMYKSLSRGKNLKEAIADLRCEFFKPSHEKRTEKHFADVMKGAAGKRLNMFLRWMVRNDNRGVDFGLWKRIPTSSLFIPLDLHSGNIARKLGLLSRKANDWKAVEELTAVLRSFDSEDPVKYDYALFGLGVNDML